MEKYEELFNPSFLKKESAAKDAATIDPRCQRTLP